MKKTILLLLILGCALAIAAASSRGGKRKQKIDTTPVSNVDLDRYTGVWYEIVRKPHSFERDLERVTATYTPRGDGTIKVENAGYKPDGRYKKSKAVARTTDTPGRLKVTFFIFPGDYNILELDTLNYSYAAVGSSSPNFLWVLARTPELPDATLSKLLDALQQRGYDLSDVTFVEQGVGED